VKPVGSWPRFSGKRRGKAPAVSSSPYAEMCAGIRLVIARTSNAFTNKTAEPGLLTSTDFSLSQGPPGRRNPSRRIYRRRNEITRQVIEYGGLFPFNVARLQKKVFLPRSRLRSVR